MSDATETQNQEQDTAPINIQAQFVKDLSFENPNPLESLLPSESQPQIAVDIQVHTENLHENIYEVTLTLKVKSDRDDKAMFLLELDYAGIVTVNVPKDILGQVLLISVPQLLFPYVRQIVGEAVSNGGFPALMLAPVDFVGLYQQQVAADEGTAKAEPEKASVN